MDGMQWIRESWLDTLALTRDWFESKDGKEDRVMANKMKLTKSQKKILSALASGQPVQVDIATCKPVGDFSLNAIAQLLKAGLIEIPDAHLFIEYGLTQAGKDVMEGTK